MQGRLRGVVDQMVAGSERATHADRNNRDHGEHQCAWRTPRLLERVGPTVVPRLLDGTVGRPDDRAGRVGGM